MFDTLKRWWENTDAIDKAVAEKEAEIRALLETKAAFIAQQQAEARNLQAGPVTTWLGPHDV